MRKKAVGLTRPAPARRDAPFRGQGRSERRGESYSVPYVEPLSDATCLCEALRRRQGTTLADFFRILLGTSGAGERFGHQLRQAVSKVGVLDGRRMGSGFGQRGFGNSRHHVRRGR